MKTTTIFILLNRNIRLLVDGSIEFVDAAANGDVVKVMQMLDNGMHPDTQGPKVGLLCGRPQSETNTR
jgi:hypothetical protein